MVRIWPLAIHTQGLLWRVLGVGCVLRKVDKRIDEDIDYVVRTLMGKADKIWEELEDEQKDADAW
jgi:hypothetical protein